MFDEATLPPLTLPERTGQPGALVARARRGERHAFEALMRQHNRLLFRTARSIAPDDAEAQDVVQETYLRAFARLGDYRGEAALGTWLARIAINVALDARRKRGVVISFDDASPCHDPLTEEPTMSLRSPEHDAPDHQAERAQVRALLESAIARLPPIYRSVFMLRAVEELSVDEAAACLQVSDAVVKTRYVRARALLRDTLGAQIEAHAHDAFAFAGARCDAVVAAVLSELDRQGHIRPG